LWYKKIKILARAQTNLTVPPVTPEITMENLNAVTLPENTIAAQIANVGADATQNTLKDIVKGMSIRDIASVDQAGQRVVGSAERALAALLNVKLADAMEIEGAHWTECAKNGVIAKALAPIKKEFGETYKAMGHSNPWTKYKRIRTMSYELMNPKIKADIGESGESGKKGAQIRTRDYYARMVIEIGKVYRAGVNADNDAEIKAHGKSKQIQAALVHVTEALKALDAPTDDDDLKAFMESFK
jgi:hypothetical protein